MTNLIQAEIRYTTLVRAQPGIVYNGITTASGLDGWFTQGTSVNPK